MQCGSRECVLEEEIVSNTHPIPTKMTRSFGALDVEGIFGSEGYTLGREVGKRIKMTLDM